jgi:5-dehydro-2-deoxygluconokinase
LPLIFYRENGAAMAWSEEDIDPAFSAEARAVVATGTHLSHPQVEAATLSLAITLAVAVGAARGAEFGI